ncbi:MAG: hypothetical protein K6G47_04710 [Clostridia bacterium]|nr:hypothetical protein [Clostridia bacterium]
MKDNANVPARDLKYFLATPFESLMTNESGKNINMAKKIQSNNKIGAANLVMKSGKSLKK